jgi:hypothetical protein
MASEFFTACFPAIFHGIAPQRFPKKSVGEQSMINKGESTALHP